MKRICSIPFSFRALQTEILFKIALYRYTHVLCNIGGGAVFLRISKHKEGKTDSGTCISKKYVGLNLDYLYWVKSISLLTIYHPYLFLFSSHGSASSSQVRCAEFDCYQSPLVSPTAVAGWTYPWLCCILYKSR